MKKFLNTAVALAMLAFATATADAQSSVDKSAADRDALTVEQALTVTSGLQQMSKYDAVDKDGKPITGYYDFSGDTRMTIALNIDLGRRLQTQFQAAQNDLIMQWIDPVTGQIPDNKRSTFNVESAKIMNAQSRVEFYHIKLSDLRLDKNPIPAPTLSMIVAIIDR